MKVKERKLTVFLTLDDTQCKNIFVVIFKKDAPPPSCHAHELFDLKKSKKRHVIALTNVQTNVLLMNPFC